jgi:hypothetical protein
VDDDWFEDGVLRLDQAVATSAQGWSAARSQGIHRRDRPEALGQLVHLDHDRADRNPPGKQRRARGCGRIAGQPG